MPSNQSMNPLPDCVLRHKQPGRTGSNTRASQNKHQYIPLVIVLNATLLFTRMYLQAYVFRIALINNPLTPALAVYLMSWT